MKYGKVITFLGGVLMGTAGVAVLSSQLFCVYLTQ